MVVFDPKLSYLQVTDPQTEETTILCSSLKKRKAQSHTTSLSSSGKQLKTGLKETQVLGFVDHL